MLEFEKNHKRGRKTFFYILLRHNWLWMLVGAGLIYLSWTIYFGNFRAFTESFLTGHPSWYINVSMLSQWILLVGTSILIVGYLRAGVMYQYYKFMLDEYAVHLHTGLFFVQETTIPYEQITNVHILRPYHFRVLGIAQFDIVTAADRGAETREIRTKKFFIPVIDTQIARILARQILECASRSRKGRHVYTNALENETDDDLNEEDVDESDSDEQ